MFDFGLILAEPIGALPQLASDRLISAALM
jgi:hypothetical protein